MHPLHRCVTLGLLLVASCASPSATAPGANDTLRAYREAFVAAAGNSLVAVRDREAFVAALPAARVLWLGDVHDSTRLHALQSELLEDLHHRGVEPVLVLEAIGTQDTKDLQRYLAGELPLEDFCRLVQQRWPGSWLDDPEFDPFFYRGLLAFAKKYNLPVVPLEPTPRAPLTQRDEAMANVVNQVAAANPTRPIVVIVGQAHLLGQGDLVHRTGLPWLALGGDPAPALRTLSRADRRRGDLWQSDSGLFWFAELCVPTE